MAVHHTIIETGIGELTLVADDDALTGIYYPQHWHKPTMEGFGPLVEASTDPLFGRVAEQFDEYLAGRRTSFEIPTAAVGDAFQKKVWALLDEIPYGETTTYGALAEKLGDRSLARIVGQAVGRNPLSVIVPCHRVVGSDGSLTGYAGGLERKRLLLELEEPDEARAEKLF